MKRFLLAALVLAASAATSSAQCPGGNCPRTPIRTVLYNLMPTTGATYSAVPPPVTTVQKSTVTTTQSTVYATRHPWLSAHRPHILFK